LVTGLSAHPYRRRTRGHSATLQRLKTTTQTSDAPNRAPLWVGLSRPWVSCLNPGRGGAPGRPSGRGETGLLVRRAARRA
jgi:hypothetical protein